MFFDNKFLQTKKMQKKSFKINQFDDLSFKDNEDIVTAVCYNFNIKNGKLTCGYGFGNVILPINTTSSSTRTVSVGTTEKVDLWQYKYYNSSTKTFQDKLFWSTADNNLGYFQIIGLTSIAIDVEMNFTDAPVGITYTVNDVDHILFSTSDGLYKLTNGEFATLQATLPKFVDLCSAYNKLWGIVEGKQNKILHSDEMDPTNWTTTEDALTLNDEQGSCNKLIKFEDNLYVFRNYGITKISEYGIKNDYAVYNLYQTKHKIYGKSVVNCGDKIIFFATDGLYSFNGSSVSKINFALEENGRGIDNKNLTATFDGENYILGLKINFNDSVLVGCESYENGYTNNAIIFYNLNTKEINVMRGVDVRCLVAVSIGTVEKVFATFYGENATKIGILNTTGNVFESVLPKCWKSKNQFFEEDFEATKIIKEVDILATENCTLKIKSESEEKDIEIVGSNSVQKINASIKGQKFNFELSSTNNSINILPFKIRYEKNKE